MNGFNVQKTVNKILWKHHCSTVGSMFIDLVGNLTHEFTSPLTFTPLNENDFTIIICCEYIL